MKIFSKKAKTSLVNYGGEIVKFENCVAEVSDELGKKILEGGYADVYEYGKQPVFQTPKEIQMKSDFKEKEDWYQKEISRLTNIANARKSEVESLKVEVATWKEEYEKEHQARLAILERIGISEGETLEEKKETSEGVVEEKESDKKAIEEIQKELQSLKKEELISFGEEMNLDMSSIKDKTKSEIIDYILENYSE